MITNDLCRCLVGTIGDALNLMEGSFPKEHEHTTDLKNTLLS